jgi:hypothetical protein
MTKRNVGHLRTVIKWVRLYENLKLYEIDHKRSSGAYLWTVTFDDLKSYKLWMAMSEEDRKHTGLLADKAPGGTILLPPGMSMSVQNPTLPKISDEDTDILNMISSGMNVSTSQMQGTENSTYASAKASTIPMSDRIQDSIATWERFLRFDLFDSLIFIASKMGRIAPSYKVMECEGFKDKKPIFRKVPKPTRLLIDFTFPSSATSNMESIAKSLLGVKHGDLPSTLGIPYSVIAEKLGFGSYGRLRQLHAVEQEQMPELLSTADAESAQEQKNNANPTTSK